MPQASDGIINKYLCQETMALHSPHLLGCYASLLARKQCRFLHGPFMLLRKACEALGQLSDVVWSWPLALIKLGAAWKALELTLCWS